MTKPLVAALVGCGKMGATYVDDPLLKSYFRYASHAEVLSAHPQIDWRAAVDIDAESAKSVATRWNVPEWSIRAADLPSRDEITFAVLAVPPGQRRAVLEQLPALRAIILEKPLDDDDLLDLCARRGIAVQVNLLRRADRTCRELAAGGLAARIGLPQAASVFYGNGICNNGIHMMDLVRMLLGEVELVSALGPGVKTGPVVGDIQVPFACRMASGLVVTGHPLDFGFYRENALEIWGDNGWLGLVLEGLQLHMAPRLSSRTTSRASELSRDASTVEATGLGEALYDMHDSLIRHVDEGAPLLSPASSAVCSTAVVHAIVRSARMGGGWIKPN